MGAVHKVYRGIYSKSNNLHNIFTLKLLETFAILSVFFLLADKKAYMTLPVEKKVLYLELLISGCGDLLEIEYQGKQSKS